MKTAYLAFCVGFIFDTGSFFIERGSENITFTVRFCLIV